MKNNKKLKPELENYLINYISKETKEKMKYDINTILVEASQYDELSSVMSLKEKKEISNGILTRFQRIIDHNESSKDQ